jgi:hypothetical protein
MACYNELNGYFPVKWVCWNPTSQCNDTMRWVLLESSYEDTVLMNELYKRDSRVIYYPLLSCKSTRIQSFLKHKGVFYQTLKLSVSWSWTFHSPEIYKKEFFLFMSHQPFCYLSQNNLIFLFIQLAGIQVLIHQ